MFGSPSCNPLQMFSDKVEGSPNFSKRYSMSSMGSRMGSSLVSCSSFTFTVTSYRFVTKVTAHW